MCLLNCLDCDYNRTSIMKIKTKTLDSQHTLTYRILDLVYLHEKGPAPHPRLGPGPTIEVKQ